MGIRKLNIVSSKNVHNGMTNGRAWSIYEYTALDEHGAMIEGAKLSGFEPFEPGLQDYEVEVNERAKPQYGPAFNVKLPGQGGGSRSSELQERLDSFDDRITRLEAGNAGTGAASPDFAAPAAAPAQAGYAPQEQVRPDLPAPSQTSLGGGPAPDDDIPF